MKNKKIDSLLLVMVLGALSVGVGPVAAQDVVNVDSEEVAKQESVAVDAEEIKANKESLEKAENAMARKDYQSAIVYLSIYIQGKPKKYEAYQLRGECFYELRQYKLAQMDFEKAIELKTADDKFITGTKVLGAVVLGADKQSQYQNPELGKMYAQLMYSQKAQNNVAYEASYQKAFEYNSHIYLPQPIKKDIAKINCPQKYGKKINVTGVDEYITDAINLIEKGQFNEAVYKTQYITSNYPKYYLGHYLTGVAYVGLEQEADAISAFEKALEVNPYDFESMASLGQIYFNDAEKTFDPKYSKKSIEYFEKALIYNPNCYTYYYYIGLNKLQTGDYDAAITSFNSAIKHNVSDYNSIYYKSIAQHLKGDYDSVIENTTGLLYRHVSNYNSVLYLRALAQYKKGNKEAALADIEKIHNNINDIYNEDLKVVSAKEQTLGSYLHYLKALIIESKGFGVVADILEAEKNPIIAQLSKSKPESWKNSDLIITYDDVDAQYDYIRTTFDELGVTFVYDEPNYKLATQKEVAEQMKEAQVDSVTIQDKVDVAEDAKVVEDVNANSVIKDVEENVEKTLEKTTSAEQLLDEDSIAGQLAAKNTSYSQVEETKTEPTINLKQSTDPMDTLLGENQSSIAHMLASNVLYSVASDSKPEQVANIDNAEVAAAESVAEVTKNITEVSDTVVENTVKNADAIVDEVAKIPSVAEDIAKEVESNAEEIQENVNISENVSQVEDSVKESIDKVKGSYVFEAEEKRETEDVKISYPQVINTASETIEKAATEVVETVETVEETAQDVVDSVVEEVAKDVEQVVTETQQIVEKLDQVSTESQQVANEVTEKTENIIKEAASAPAIVEKHAKVDLSEFNVQKSEPEIKDGDDVVYFDPVSYITEVSKQFEKDVQVANANSSLKSSAAEIVQQAQESAEAIDDVTDDLVENIETVENTPTMITNKLKSVVTSGSENLPNEVVAPIEAETPVVAEVSKPVAVPVVVVPALNVPVKSKTEVQETVAQAEEAVEDVVQSVESVESVVEQVADSNLEQIAQAEESVLENKDEIISEVVEDKTVEPVVDVVEEDKEQTAEESISSIVQSVFVGSQRAQKSEEEQVQAEIGSPVSEESVESEKPVEFVEPAEIVKVKKEKKSWFSFFKRKKKEATTQAPLSEDSITQVEEVVQPVEENIVEVSEDAVQTVEENVAEEVLQEVEAVEEVPAMTTDEKVEEMMKEIVGTPVNEPSEKNVNSPSKTTNEVKPKKKKFVWWWDREEERELEDEATGGEIFGLMKNFYGEDISKELGVEEVATPIRTNGQRTILKEIKK